MFIARFEGPGCCWLCWSGFKGRDVAALHRCSAVGPGLGCGTSEVLPMR